MFMLRHWYSHRGLGCGKMIKLTLIIFNIFGDFYTRDGTIWLCQRNESAQIVMSHKVQYTSFGSILFTPSLVSKWHDRHRYLSMHHMPYLMRLSSPRQCRKTLICISKRVPGRPEIKKESLWIQLRNLKPQRLQSRMFSKRILQYFSKPGDTFLVLPGRRNATACPAWRRLGLPCAALPGQTRRTQTHTLGR